MPIFSCLPYGNQNFTFIMANLFILHAESKSMFFADAFHVPCYATLSSTPNHFHVVRSKTIIGEKHCGGLKKIDFEIMERSLKIAWIKRIAESSNASWKIIPNQALSHYGGLEFLIECDYDPKLLNLENVPEFCHAILNHWHDFRRLTCDKQISIKKNK